MIRILLISALLISPIISHGQVPQYKNIIVLLDLSNRIKPDKNPNQANKDQQIIEGILESFENRQRRFLFQRSKDKLSIVVANQKDSQVNVHQFDDDLSIDMEQPDDARRMNKPVFDKERKAFEKALQKLYSDAIKSRTTGADIWSYFRDNLNSNINSASEYQNYVIILTDGYMDLDKDLAKKRPSGTYMSYGEIHKLRNQDNWQSIFENQNMVLKPHAIDYGNLNALVLEVVPKDPVVNINELPIIKKFWGTWLEEMDIDYQIYTSNDNVNATINITEEFIFNK